MRGLWSLPGACAAVWLAAAAVPSASRQGTVAVRTADAPLAVTLEHPAVEPHVAVSPESAARVVIGAIVRSPERSGAWTCVALATADGGRSWTRHDLVMDGCIDPWVVWTPGGTVLLSAIEVGRERPDDQRFRLVVLRSADGGTTWSDPVDLGTGHDHAVMAADPADPSGEAVLLASRRATLTADGHPRHQVFVARSDDAGRSFAPTADMTPHNLALNVTGLERLADGSLLVSYIDFQRNVDGFGAQGMLDRPRAWVIRRPAGGGPFEAPQLVTEECGMQGGFPGYPILAAGGPEPAGEVLYHACVRRGFDGIAVTRSRDGGETWSEPTGLPARADGTIANVRVPMLAAGADGTLGVAWYDRRQDSSGECQDVYFTASVDGGSTFLPEVRVSTETSCPGAPGNGVVGQSWASGGDYSSLAAAPDGAFRLVWADSRSGRSALRTAVLEVANR